MENGEAQIRRSLVACCCGPNPALRLKAQLTPKYYCQLLLLSDGGLQDETPQHRATNQQQGKEIPPSVFLWVGLVCLVQQ